jgi:hypothetical protein
MTSSNSFTGTNHFISLLQAIEMTKKYRAEKENILAPEFRNRNILLTCETFDRNAFDALLSENGCMGIRLYFGMTENLQVRVVAVGVNEKNEDMLPAQREVITINDEANVIVEEGLPCPEVCPPPSPLNEG